jgi:hypothetical protein
LLALTRAIEDECCARAERAVLLASFQQERFYLHSRDRWHERARVTVDFAAAAREPPRPAEPILVALPADSPARARVTLVCDALDYPACLTGWEIPDRTR